MNEFRMINALAAILAAFLLLRVWREMRKKEAQKAAATAKDPMEE